MTRLIRFLALLLTLLLPSTASAADQAQRVSEPPEFIRQVANEMHAREQQRGACAADQVPFHQAILKGILNAGQVAKSAADRGCFGLIATVSGIPSGIPYAPGVECRPNQQLFIDGRLTLLFISPGTDAVSSDPAQRKRDDRAFATDRAFALAYNAAVIADPRFPYADLCRAAPTTYRPSWREERAGVVHWGFRPLAETAEPRNMYEAARRGTLGSLRRLIDARPLDIHLPDMLGLTPLAWAVIYDRPDHIRLLLAAGAHPYGEPFRTDPTKMSPYTIAQAERRRDLTAIMRPALEARGLTPPNLPAQLDISRSLPVDIPAGRVELTVSPTGQVTDCHLIVGNGHFAYPMLCDPIQEATKYFPAENADGDPIASTVLYDRNAF